MPNDSDKRKEAQKLADAYSRSLREDENRSSWSGLSGSTSGAGSSGLSNQSSKFKNYIPTDKLAQKDKSKFSFFTGNNGGGGGYGPDNGGGGGGAFAAPHRQNNPSSSKGRSNSLCDSGYSSSSSTGRSSSFNSFNLGSPHSQQENNRSSFGSSGFGSLENYGGCDRNRHPASSGSSGHRQYRRSLSESSASSMGSSGGFSGLSLSAIYESEFGKKNKKK
ncbi:hypothetical protein ACHWQZ_G000181 [Mnemiopsis leidyi]